MNKTKTIVFIAFVLAMGAGVAVGMLGSRALPSSAGGLGMRDRIIEELQLTPDQQKQMNDIWMEMIRTKGREFGEEFRSIQQQREQAVKQLLNPQQSAEYERINQEFIQRSKDLWARAETAFNATADKTRQILNESQRQKFDAMLTKFKAQRPAGGWPGPAGFPASPATPDGAPSTTTPMSMVDPALSLQLFVPMFVLISV